MVNLNRILLLIIAMSQRASLQVLACTSKRISIVRHGQAMHNPRAEVAKANGCSMEEFIAIMREDDCLDAPLTDLGKEQAKTVKIPTTKSNFDLVVSSSLSRALQTADAVCPPSIKNGSKRVCCEHFREVNGDLLNAKRRSRSELEKLFPSWDFSHLSTDEDSLWTPEMEEFPAVAERGYIGLDWLMKRPEESILLVAHGGILRYLMTIHPLISLQDERKSAEKPVEARFDNCEVRHYRLSWINSDNMEEKRRKIVMTEVDP
ncbi:unnamed protein product [Cylindrotheca closterium]|uniref:Phosphoglycerate mutase (2,3-diphosphoglycerate-dependent) n=1 Tax=Cylindrotheca closterium TaxID=2856 RepID=A0AAD2JMG5_9STRA|nr:unnamed protein product [Cylindrotheca closterium]